MGLFDNPWHILIVLLVLVLLFGSAKLPKAAKSMGEAMRIFKKEAQKLHEDDQAPASHVQAAAPPQVAAPAPPVAAPASGASAQDELAALKQQMDALQQQVAHQQAPPNPPAS
jgi:sec-independent protein translocase protein TatA